MILFVIEGLDSKLLLMAHLTNYREEVISTFIATDLCDFWLLFACLSMSTCVFLPYLHFKLKQEVAD